MTALAAGSTLSRMTQLRHGVLQGYFSGTEATRQLGSGGREPNELQ
jgi:hypothetical protein